MHTIVFEPTLNGHHLEYLHHLYMGAADRVQEQYTFAVPHDAWAQMKDKLQWPAASNISFYMMDDAECENVQSGNMFNQCWKESKLISKVTKATDADMVFLPVLTSAIPFLPYLLPKRAKVRGILYKIYIRSNMSGLRLAVEKLRYRVMAHHKKVDKVFILNDETSACELRERYGCERFVMLPDPVPYIDANAAVDIRPNLGISENDTMFLHFGAMSERKGTLMILQAILLMPTDKLKDKVFIFAGRIASDIRKDFHSLVKDATVRGARIIVNDAFLEYDELNNYCFSSDCMLMPYLLTDLSSGVIGYASVFEKPVIGPATGLIGELICKYHLGQTLNSITPETIANAILNFTPQKSSSEYAKHNSIDRFIEVAYSK